MDIQKLLTEASDAMGVRRVFGDPFEKDGVTIIPAARVQGGGGGGSADKGSSDAGGGGGFGLNARPVGAYVIKDHNVTWVPAIDINRVIGAATAITILGLRTAVNRRRRKRAKR